MRAKAVALKSTSMPRFEQRVLLGSLLCACPGMMGLLWIVSAGAPSPPWAWGLVLMAVIATALLARWQLRRLMFPLYTLAGLLEALRQGDYSLRGVQGGALGDVVYDINALAERLQQERLEFEESSFLLSKTLAALDGAVFVFDEATRLRLVNPAAERLLDAPRAQLFGRDAEALGLSALLQGPPSILLTRAFPGQQGRFDVRHAALRSKGRGGKLLVINDVGRVLRAEERQAWQRLLRVLGHEVNNSLAPIQSMAGTLASLLARDPLPADWQEDFRGGLEVIGHRAGALGRFLSSYSKLARLPPPRRRDVELSSLIEKVARLEQRLPVHIEAGEAMQLHADADQLEQALINLLRNAVEATLPREGKVTIRWAREGEHAVIDIEDEGAGLPPSDNLFVPFFTTKPGGSGIGLALVRQIAEAHEGGALLVAREEGVGARARLWLPLVNRA
jgi:nitrogen fixation/metabolism regulation signal transduction histidine kinase